MQKKILMRAPFLTACLLLMCAVTGLVWAAPVLKLTAPPSEVDAGKPFLYEIRVEWPVGEGSYEVATGVPELGNLKVLDQSQTQETSGKVSRLVLRFSLQGIKKGPAQISAMAVRYRLSENEGWHTLPVPAQTITIQTPFPWSIILGTLFALILLPLSFIYGRRGIQAYLEARRIKKLPPPDPKQRTYAKVEERILTYKGETQSQTITHWGTCIKETVITYYDLGFRSATGSEILRALRSKALGKEEFSEIERIFNTLETLQYSSQTLSVREMESLQKTLLQYVRGKIIIKKLNS